MKRVLFWITFPFIGLLLVVMNTFAGLAEYLVEIVNYLDDKANEWEDWCFGE